MRDYNRSASASEYPEPREIYSSPVNRNVASVTVSIANLTLTGGLIWMRADSPTETIVFIAYFALSTSLFLLIDSGQFVLVIRIIVDAFTQRHRDKLTYTVHRPIADPLPEPAPPVPALPQTSSFVPAYDIDRSDWLEAKTWLTQLFDLATGQPDPKKVLGPDTADPNRIRCKMPSKPVTQFLLDRRIIRKHNSGYALSPRYSLLRDVLDAIDLTPVPTAPVGGYTLGGGVS